MRELNEIRQDINTIDTEIRALFLKRMELALEVAATKVNTGDKILKPDREAEILEKRSEGIPADIRQKYLSLQRSIMRASREAQYAALLEAKPDLFPARPSAQALNPQKVCYQGVPGAYAEIAAANLFPESVRDNLASWEQVFEAVHDGSAEVGIVPVENTTAGAVNEVYDLLNKYDLSINRSCVQKICHCLAAAPGATLDSVERVCSHPHALPQCADFIKAHGYASLSVANTAIAAQRVQSENDPGLAAICSRQAAERYGLTILAEGINDEDHNETRFIAVSPCLTALPDDNRIEICFKIKNEAGSLDTVLSLFADYDIDMTEIHSRPMKDSPWCYIFYVDFTGNLFDANTRALLYQLHEELPYIKVIGCYRAD